MKPCSNVVDMAGIEQRVLEVQEGDAEAGDTRVDIKTEENLPARAEAQRVFAAHPHYA